MHIRQLRRVPTRHALGVACCTEGPSEGMPALWRAESWCCCLPERASAGSCVGPLLAPDFFQVGPNFAFLLRVQAILDTDKMFSGSNESVATFVESEEHGAGAVPAGVT
jgi:hypothetical protein